MHIIIIGNDITIFRSSRVEVVNGPSGGHHGEKMLTVVPFSDLTLLTSSFNAVLYTVSAVGSQRLAGHERPPGSGSRLGRE